MEWLLVHRNASCGNIKAEVSYVVFFRKNDHLFWPSLYHTSEGRWHRVVGWKLGDFFRHGIAIDHPAADFLFFKCLDFWHQLHFPYLLLLSSSEENSASTNLSFFQESALMMTERSATASSSPWSSLYPGGLTNCANRAGVMLWLHWVFIYHIRIICHVLRGRFDFFSMC